MPVHRFLLLLISTSLFGQPYTISTLAGQGKAGAFFDNPTSLAVDSAGNVYVSDWSGFIRKIWVKDGGTSIIAGTGILSYGGDGGQATNAKLGQAIALTLDSSGNLYIADSNNNCIRRVELLTGIITTVAGTGAAVDSGDGGAALEAGVSRPTGVVTDREGNIYFSSSWSRVRKISSRSGIIETVAGQSVTSFGGDGGPAIGALFWDPLPSAVDAARDLYITDFENSRVRQIKARSGIVTTIVGSASCSGGIPGLNDVVSCLGGFGGDGGPARLAMLNHPQGSALDAAGNLYIADTSNHRIRLVDARTQLISTIAGNGTSGLTGDGGPAITAEISFPVSIALDRFGRVYFADESNNRIRMLTPVEQPWNPFRGQRCDEHPAGCEGR